MGFCFSLPTLNILLSLCVCLGSEFCFRNFTSPTGMIESPGFPDKYPHNLECSYMIIAPPHMDITLTFLTFDLENDPLLVGEGDCKYDWLDVWDGLPQGERTDTHRHTQTDVGISQRERRHTGKTPCPHLLTCMDSHISTCTFLH